MKLLDCPFRIVKTNGKTNLKKEYEIELIVLKDELSSFIFRLVTNQQDTEDIVQETFLKTLEKIDFFQQKSSFKTWVFTIALNIAKNHLNKQKRWVENAQDFGATLHATSSKDFEKLKSVFQYTSERTYDIKEHISYCFNCINKTLLLKQQVCLLLKDIYHFKVSEIMQITNLTEGVVKHALADAKKTMISIFDNRCSFVNKKGVCHQCTSLTGALNPKQNAHIKAQQLKLVKEGSSSPNKEYLLDLRLELIANIDPLSSPNTIVTNYMLEHSERWVNEGIEKKPLKLRPK